MDVLKNETRRVLKRIRSGIPSDCLDEKNQLIAKHLMQLFEIRSARVVMSYLSYGSEADTWGIVKRLYDVNKRVCAPFVRNGQDMAAGLLRSPSDTVGGLMGISEPSSKEPFPKDKIDVCIIPGLGFSEDGARVGYGRGYYDRFLADYKGVKVGLAFEEQILERIPAADHDVKMDYIVTDKRVMIIGKKTDH